MKVLLFTATLIFEVLLTGSFLWSVLFPKKRIWPPPGWTSWQFWSVWVLTVASLIGFFAVSLLDWNSFVYAHWSRFLVGGVVFAAGTLFALWGVVTLGLHTAAGLKGELTTRGPYRCTRNPQYIGDFGVLVGWAVVSNSSMTIILTGIGIVCFSLAAVCEEPWLEEEFGDRYRDYMQRVGRFVPRLTPHHGGTEQ